MKRISRVVTSLAVVPIVAFVTPAKADLVAWWKLDETGGTIAHDQTGVYNGILAGNANFVSGGISGNAISLSHATNDLINVGSAFPNFTNVDYTLITWVETTDTQSAAPAAKHETGTANGYFNALNVSGPYGVPGKAYVFNGGGPSNTPVSTTSVNDGVWHQIVGERSGGNALIYIDGTLEGAVSAGIDANSPAPFLIGGVDISGVATNGYNGLVDDVQVYNTALSASSVNTLFHNPGTAIGFQAATPEPGTFALLSAIGVVGVGFVRKRRRIRKS